MSLPERAVENSSVESNASSRREFLKSSGIMTTGLMTGAAVAGQLAVARSAHAAGSDVLKVGLVGCGGRGTGAALQALKADKNTKLVAMGDAFPDAIQSSLANLKKSSEADRVDVPAERQFSGFDNYKKVCDADVDVVLLAAPPHFRPEHFEYAVKAGCHSFVEKPVAVDAPGVTRVLNAVAESKKKKLAVGVGLQRHHEKKYIETIKRLQDGEIGDIIAARAYWNGGGVWDPRVTREQTKSDLEYQVRNWYYYNWLSGDHICE